MTNTRDDSPDSRTLSWQEAERTAIIALRSTIQRELSGAVIIQILSEKHFTVSGPNVLQFFDLEFDDLSDCGPNGFTLVLGHWLAKHLGHEWSDSFFASWYRRWRWTELFKEARIGEFDGMFVAITKSLGILFLVAEVKHHERPVGRSLLEAFAHRLRRIEANKGYYISTSGFQAGAVELARREGIALLHIPLGDLQAMSEVEHGATLSPEHYYLLKAIPTESYLKGLEESAPRFRKNLEYIGFVFTEDA